LEIKQRAQRGMTLLILTYIFVMAAKTLIFKGFRYYSFFSGSSSEDWQIFS